MKTFLWVLLWTLVIWLVLVGIGCWLCWKAGWMIGGWVYGRFHPEEIEWT